MINAPGQIVSLDPMAEISSAAQALPRPSVKVVCPRCGYDQTGVRATFVHEHPLESTCSECGLVIEWALLLSPRLAPPAWCIEYGSGLGVLVRRLPRTIGLCYLPWQFWKSLRMIDPVRPRRLLLLIIVLLAFLYAAVSIGTGARAMNNWDRIVLYYGGVPNPPTATDAMFAYALPFLDHAPAQTIAQFRMASTRSTLVHASRPIRWALALTGPPLLLCPLMFLALPVSRRRAKVRWSHLFRITAYTSVFLLVPLGFAAAANVFGVHGLELPMIATTFRAAQVLLMIAAVPTLLLFWGFACSRYLRMPHPWGIALAVWVAALLLQASLVLYYTFPKMPW